MRHNTNPHLGSDTHCQQLIRKRIRALVQLCKADFGAPKDQGNGNWRRDAAPFNCVVDEATWSRLSGGDTPVAQRLRLGVTQQRNLSDYPRPMVNYRCENFDVMTCQALNR